jgi:hypothetical protein
MKSLEFKEFKRADSTVENYGTVKEQVGKGGTIGLLEDNFKDHSKRVAIVLKRANGNSVIVSCSERASKALREKKVTLPNLMEMSIIVGENGIPFISSQGGRIQEFKVDDLKPSVAQPSTSFLTQEDVKQLLEAAV